MTSLKKDNWKDKVRSLFSLCFEFCHLEVLRRHWPRQELNCFVQRSEKRKLNRPLLDCPLDWLSFEVPLTLESLCKVLSFQFFATAERCNE